MSGHTRTILSERVIWPDYEKETFRPGTCHQVVDRIVMIEGPKTVSIYEHQLLKGTSKNGVVWHKWKTKKSNHYSVKTGHLESYNRQGNFFYTSTKGGFEYNRNDKVCAAINRLLLRNGLDVIDDFHGQCIFKASYPLFAKWDWQIWYAKGIPHMRSKDMQEFTLKLFGKTRYRKDLVRAVANTTHPNILKNAYWMRGLVPVDWIIKYMNENNHIGSHLAINALPIRPGFRNMTMNQRKAVMTALSSKNARDNQYSVEDLLEFASDLPKETVQAVKMKPSTLYDAHIILSREHTKLRNENRVIEPTKLAKQILEIDWSDTGFTMLPATGTHQVIDWGTEMNHCIGGYRNQAVDGKNTLTGLYRDGKLFGNAMFDAKSCVQIFGKNNQALPNDVLNAVMDKLPKISFRYTWGVPEKLRRKTLLERITEDDGLLDQPINQPWLDPVPF